MNLDLVIYQIRNYVPQFEGRVGGAIDYFRAKDQGFLQQPAAYVIPFGDEPEHVYDEAGYHQNYRERIAVIVAIDEQPAVMNGDRRGQAASQQFDLIRWSLFRALLNWNPDPEHADNGIYYFEGMPLDPTMAQAFFQFIFALDVQITQSDVWVDPAVPLEGVDIFVINPQDREDVLASANIDLPHEQALEGVRSENPNIFPGAQVS